MSVKQRVHDAMVCVKAVALELERLHEGLDGPDPACKPPEGLGRKLLAVCRLGAEMRRVQREYFATRNGKLVRESKALEQKFDAELSEALELARGV